MRSYLVIPILLLAVLAGCPSADPRQDRLEERAGWSVDVQSWVPVDGGVKAVLLVVAPPRASLDTLTVRARLYGAGDAIVGEQWLPLDVADVRTGAGREMTVSLETGDAEVEAMTVEVVVDPTPEEERHIRELQGLAR